MDPITAAIVAALAADAVSRTNKMAEQAISGAYGKLKGLIRKKLGEKSKVVNAVRDLEANPKSEARKAVVNEEVTAAKADKDEDLLKIAQELVQAIKAKPGGEQIIQLAMGDQNVQIAGDGNIVNVNTPKKKH